MRPSVFPMWFSCVHNQPIALLRFHGWEKSQLESVHGKNMRINPKSIPNSEKQKQLPNTQWVKYVYCPALFTLEVGRTRCNHSTNTLWKNAFPKAFAILWPICPKLVRRAFFPKNCCPPHSSLHLPNIHHPHLLCPLHHLHLLYHLLHHLL